MNNTGNLSKLSDKFISFAHFLRSEGYLIGIKEVTAGMQAVVDSDQLDQKLVYHYLRSICCRNRDEWLRFSELFHAFWYPGRRNTNDSRTEVRPVVQSLQSRQGTIAGMAGAAIQNLEAVQVTGNMGGAGAGRHNTIAKADFRFLNNQYAMREAERLAEKLALHLKSRIRVRRKVAVKGNRIDMRHTLRANMIYGGTPVHPKFTVRYKEPPHLVILHDVSHSMTWNNPVLFRFVRGLIRAFPECEVFVFHTRLFRVTDIYKERSIQQMREKLEAKNNFWMGGTCIAESLDYFNRHYADTTLRKHSTLMMISDGFDTDSPAYLAHQLSLIKQSCKQLFWLNPMIGRKGYRPDTATMIAAKPYVNKFAAAHSIEALREVVYSMNR